jgi:hypothetical protein
MKNSRIVIEFKKRSFEKGKKRLIEMINSEISTTNCKRKVFSIALSDTKKTITFSNAEVAYYEEMYAIKVFVAPARKKITHGYQIGENNTIELRLNCDAIKSINGKKLINAICELEKSQSGANKIIEIFAPKSKNYFAKLKVDMIQRKEGNVIFSGIKEISVDEEEYPSNWQIIMPLKGLKLKIK